MLTGITIIFVIAWCLTVLLRRASAALRHAVWTCAFAAVLLLAPLRWRAPHRIIAPPLPAILAIADTATVAAPAPRHSRVDASTFLSGIWALGAVVLILRLARNAIRLRAIVKAAHGNPPILTSPAVRGPLVVGLFRPVILLPPVSSTWTVSRRRAVLAHEAAHIRRLDPPILLAAQIATALYWFHPLCWYAAARLRAESESACDDAALRIGLRPSGYAGHLLELACRFETQLAIPMATTSHLESRVKSILDPLTNRSVPTLRAWLAAIAVSVALLAPLATLTLRAQQGPSMATITGTVIDPTGAAIPNARVTATSSDSGAQEIAISNTVGAYTFAGIPGGYYTIEVQVPGFTPFRMENVAVINGGKVQANAHLIVGGLSERMTVAARGTPQNGPSPAGPSGPVRVGGNVQPAKLLQRVSAIYPDDLQAQGIEGTVLIAAIISKEGVPSSLKVLKDGGNDEFAAAATNAVQQWRYQPALLNGEPTSVLINIQVDFKLSEQAPYINDGLRPARIPALDNRLPK